MGIRLPAVMLLLGLCQAAPAAPTGSICPPQGWTRESLQSLKQAGFKLADDARRNQLALALLECLGDPDPLIRDGLAFEANSAWLRGNQLDQRTRVLALQRLLPRIAPEAADEAGFLQTFSALVLAELARADRKAPYLSGAQRQQLLDAAARYLSSVTDYRGYDAREGWRHGVAHGADLLMQLSLNPALDKAQLDQLLAAVRRQVAPAGEHFYVYGEPERLARPLLFTAMRGLHSPAEWKAWFADVANPAPLANWNEAFLSNPGLARRHNTFAFLLVLHAQLSASENPKLRELLPEVSAALAAMQ